MDKESMTVLAKNNDSSKLFVEIKDIKHVGVIWPGVFATGFAGGRL